MSKKVIQIGVTTTTDYLSGFQYKKKTASEPVELQFFPHAEGYVNATQNGTSYTFNYVYNYTDHLGNIRLSYSQDPSTNVLKVIEENHYYPFGLKHTGYNSDQMMYVKEEYIVKIKPRPVLFKTSYDKKFNGKSWETDLSLNVYDFHARGYMPDIVRTFQQDPLAEKFSNMSPYSFLNNNPLSFIDPNGMEAIPPIGFDQEDGAQHTDKDGSWVYNKSTNVWEGKNGTQSYDNMITLSELTINMPDRYEGTYFDKDNKGSGIYGPYIPDAIGINFTFSVNTGLFGNFGANIGGAVDKQNNSEGFVGGYMDIGYNGKVGIPKFSFGASIDFHDSYIGNNGSVPANSIPGGILGNLGGTNQTYNGGIGLTGGYSYSIDPVTKQKMRYGVETKSVGLGLGLNIQAGGSKSWTFSEIYNAILKTNK